MKQLYLIFIYFLLIGNQLFAQSKINEWTDHLSYNNANSVAKVGDIVYVSNGNGLGKYNTSDNSTEKYTKINGLSDVGIKLIKVNETTNDLFVLYNNANIDIIKPSGQIINISDIKRKSIQGKKTLNEIFFNGSIAYVACGFGIIKLDIEKNEIKDTYIVGTATSNYEVFEVTQNDTALFAATKNGVFYGNLQSNLSFYQNWKLLNIGNAAGPYNSIINFNGVITTNYSERIKSNQSFKDTVYQLTQTGWIKYPYISGSENKKLYNYTKNGLLFVNDQWGVRVIKENGIGIDYISSYQFENSGAIVNDVFYDSNANYWIADGRYGLVKTKGSYPAPAEKITFNGPETNLVNEMAINDGLLYMAPTDLGDLWNNQYQQPFAHVFQNNEWTKLNTPQVYDITCVAVDPNDKNHSVFGCWGPGIVELNGNNITKIHNYNNSTLSAAYGSVSDTRIGGVAFDKESNLWAVSSLNKSFLNIKKKDNTWTKFDFPFAQTINPQAGRILIDKSNQVWIIIARGAGMMVFNPTTALNQPILNQNTKIINTDIGSGALPTNDIYSMIEDVDGKIWVGTGKGITVFNNPEAVFTSANWDSKQILIDSDGQVKILLENDIIRTIAVDGINQKWVGTSSSGVYCLSPDGQKEIFHFTTDNSPLYSNYINDIVFDDVSGDVFIGHELGIQSFKTKNIKGFEEFTNVHAFPNPIRPGFQGNVYITGLIDEANVKITDVAGNLVWQTTSTGGRIEWNLQNFEGKRAASGIYIIHCASASGDKSALTKLLIVN